MPNSLNNKKIINRLPVAAAVLTIRVYQAAKGFFLPPSCRYYPTCSAYAVDALHKYGLISGAWRAIKRIGRCHPFHPGGYDPA